ncbi:uncharacterized protein B0J16DRAFT_372167 [Fusarium flagelliforme]|uniref:uncharacterized protein n=1 Tax=Fusarium flagelliforme TaxID=2675880 RepID=UPI001E8CFE70|nr:uncharacterized protein B0J16DRAFT_372167 [Fusarium flagelliforme]KAH7185356.1 hypothetical protein B0J16DRAFT_372167 [Fusarium flagelliforme]
MSRKSNSSSSGGSEIDAEVFGPLTTIAEHSLRALASRVARDVGISTDSSFDNTALVRRISGSYNIVHIMEVETTKLVIRVPAFGWGAGMSKAAADALKSQVATMRLIRKKTKVPVPEVYSFDATDANEINAPFICLEFIPAEDGTNFLGPLFNWQHEDGSQYGSVRVQAARTYVSTIEYLACHFDFETEKSSWDRASNKMLEALVQSSPNLNSHSRFVLCPPDFDSQNILVDPESGSVVGLIDWDLCHTMPPHMGYARYPGFITRDWDPLMYRYPVIKTEDSPETLQRFRQHYNNELGKSLLCEGDWEFTKNSHISEAIWNAALNSFIRKGILRRFIEVALGIEDKDALAVLYDLDGYCSPEDWNKLKGKLEQLVCGSSSLPGAA